MIFRRQNLKTYIVFPDLHYEDLLYGKVLIHNEVDMVVPNQCELGNLESMVKMTDPDMVLRVERLTKTYDELTAVEDVSFSLRRGEIIGLLGPNGAGKTTIVNIILGILEPSAGSIYIEGRNLAKQRAQALSSTNFAAVYAPVPGNLSVRQNLLFFGRIYGIRNVRRRVNELITQFALERFVNTKCGLLSSGEQTRVTLAKAMVNHPRLLLLDEPTASLDPSTARDIRAFICEMARQDETGILWTSHNMLEVQEVCDRVLFMSHGKVLLEGDPRRLPDELGAASLEEIFVRVAREPLTLGVGR